MIFKQILNKIKPKKETSITVEELNNLATESIDTYKEEYIPKIKEKQIKNSYEKMILETSFTINLDYFRNNYTKNVKEIKPTYIEAFDFFFDIDNLEKLKKDFQEHLKSEEKWEPFFNNYNLNTFFNENYAETEKEKICNFIGEKFFMFYEHLAVPMNTDLNIKQFQIMILIELYDYFIYLKECQKVDPSKAIKLRKDLTATFKNYDEVIEGLGTSDLHLNILNYLKNLLNNEEDFFQVIYYSFLSNEAKLREIETIKDMEIYLVLVKMDLLSSNNEDVNIYKNGILETQTLNSMLDDFLLKISDSMVHITNNVASNIDFLQNTYLELINKILRNTKQKNRAEIENIIEFSPLSVYSLKEILKLIDLDNINTNVNIETIKEDIKEEIETIKEEVEVIKEESSLDTDLDLEHNLDLEPNDFDFDLIEEEEGEDLSNIEIVEESFDYGMLGMGEAEEVVLPFSETAINFEMGVDVYYEMLSAVVEDILKRWNKGDFELKYTKKNALYAGWLEIKKQLLGKELFENKIGNNVYYLPVNLPMELIEQTKKSDMLIFDTFSQLLQKDLDLENEESKYYPRFFKLIKLHQNIYHGMYIYHYGKLNKIEESAFDDRKDIKLAVKKLDKNYLDSSPLIREALKGKKTLSIAPDLVSGNTWYEIENLPNGQGNLGGLMAKKTTTMKKIEKYIQMKNNLLGDKSQVKKTYNFEKVVVVLVVNTLTFDSGDYKNQNYLKMFENQWKKKLNEYNKDIHFEVEFEVLIK